MTHIQFSSPRPPLEFKLLSLLQPRLDLPHDIRERYKRLQTGYEGEMKFSKLLDKELYADCIQLFGLQFEIDQTEFQIDSLIIFHNKIYLFEIKNYAGDYLFNEDSWKVVSSNIEIRNPLHQLKRCEILLRQLLQKLGYNIDIEVSILYVNSEFFLYQAPFDQSLVFPNQLKRLVMKLNSNKGRITNNHKKFADHLVMQIITRSSHERLPNYTYEALRKGIVCNGCHTFLQTFNQTNLVCNNCGNKENVDAAVFRSVAEFQTLFPDRKITTSIIHDWCKIIESKKTIRRILKRNFIQVGSRKSVHYLL